MAKLHRILYILIFVIAVFLRLFLLGNIPNGVTNDEASYIYNAYTIWHSGKDITGKFLPLSLNLDNSFSPVPLYIIAPFVGLFDLSAFTGRLPFALFGIGVVILVYLIAKKLFKNEWIALLSMFVISVSPWHLQISRIAYEAGLALFFYLAGIYLFLTFSKERKMLLSLLPFFLGFYSYHATKVFFIFLIPVLIFYTKDFFIKRKAIAVCFVLGCIAIISSYFLASYINKDTRQKVFLWNDVSSSSSMVNSERRINTAPHILQNIYSNKALYFLRIIRENYLQTYSPQFLFLYGETGGLGGIYGTNFRGELYFLELPFLILGLSFLYTYKDKKIRNFLFLLLLIAPLPTAFTIDQTYVMRTILLLPLLTIVIGCGLYKAYFLIMNIKRRELQIITFGLCVFLYAFFITEYLYQYYYRYSIYAAESWFKSDKDLLEYVLKHQNEYKKVIIINVGDLLIQYAFYSKMDQQTAATVYKSMAPEAHSNSPKKVGPHVFLVDGCFDVKAGVFDPEKYLDPHTLYIAPDSCYPKSTIPLKRITQSGEPLRTIWKIYAKN